MKLLSMLWKSTPEELARKCQRELERISQTPYATIDDRIGRRLAEAGLCRREWFEGLGAGCYIYYPAQPAPGRGRENDPG